MFTPKVVIVTSKDGIEQIMTNSPDVAILTTSSDTDVVQSSIDNDQDVSLVPGGWDPSNQDVGEDDTPEILGSVEVDVDPEYVESVHDYWDDTETRQTVDKRLRKHWWDNLRDVTDDQATTEEETESELEEE